MAPNTITCESCELSRAYDKAVPTADRLYDTYLDELRKEGLING